MAPALALIVPLVGAFLLIGAAPGLGFPLALGIGLLHWGKAFYPQGFLWLAFLPGLLRALALPFPSWLPGWALTSGLLLLYGLFLAAKKQPFSSLFLLPIALWLGPLGLFLLGLLHGFSLLEEAHYVVHVATPLPERPRFSLPVGVEVRALSPVDALDHYLRARKVPDARREKLLTAARELVEDTLGSENA